MSRKSGGDSSEGLSPDFLDFIVSLNEQKVDYVLVGGYALGVHGVVRATGDIAFLFRRTKKNVRRLCAAMLDFGAPPEVIDEQALMTVDIVTQFGKPPFRIDLLNAIDAVTFQEVSKGADIVSIEGHRLLVFGMSELKKNKAATGRKKDQDDLRRLRKQAARKKR